MAKKKRATIVKRPGKRFWPYGLLIFALVLLIDQYTKRSILSSYAVGESHQICPMLSFTFIQNTGALWSIATGMNGMFIWLSIIALGFLMFYHDQFKTTTQKVALALLFAGIWGNLLDRLSLGYVIDFIDLHWWPVFNIADSAIVVAICVILIGQFKKD